MLVRRAKAYSSSCSQTVKSISSCFHERLANNGKITFTGIPLFDALVRRFPWT